MWDEPLCIHHTNSSLYHKAALDSIHVLTWCGARQLPQAQPRLCWLAWHDWEPPGLHELRDVAADLAGKATLLCQSATAGPAVSAAASGTVAHWQLRQIEGEQSPRAALWQFQHAVPAAVLARV